MQEIFGLVYQWHGSIYLGGEGHLLSCNTRHFVLLSLHVKRICGGPAQLAAGSKETIC